MTTLTIDYAFIFHNTQMNDQASNQDFQHLITNAIYFLKIAMEQLEDEPKQSVINFYTALELFLKGPLVHEHWSLIIANDQRPNLEKYRKGDFQSINFNETCARLQDTLNSPLKKEAKIIFDIVRKHRNRLVHFYHTGIEGEERNQIKIEQANAWFELNKFVTKTWQKIFTPFINDFRKMENELVTYNHYAQVKFDNIKGEIKYSASKGNIFITCSKCGTNACLAKIGKSLTSANCLVCLDNNHTCNVTCPDCQETNQKVSAYSGFSCSKCQKTITAQNELFDLLEQSTILRVKDYLDSVTPANCDECQSYQSVCEYEGRYLCVNCLTVFDQLYYCEWCNEPMTDSAEDTYAFGCEQCDGYGGYHAND